MRRLLYMLLGVAAAVAVSAGVATGAQPHASVVRCKPNNITGPPCLSPNVNTSQISAKCKKSGTKIRVPTISVSANAGIRKITITSGGKTVKVLTFKGSGPLTKSVSGVAISTKGLKHGVYTIKITVTDTLGKKKSITRRFAICKPAPVFTG